MKLLFFIFRLGNDVTVVADLIAQILSLIKRHMKNVIKFVLSRKESFADVFLTG